MEFVDTPVSVSRWSQKRGEIVAVNEVLPLSLRDEAYTLQELRGEVVTRLVRAMQEHSEEDVRDGVMVNTLFAYGRSYDYEYGFVDAVLCTGSVERLIQHERLSYRNALMRAASGYMAKAGDNRVVSVCRFESQVAV